MMTQLLCDNGYRSKSYLSKSFNNYVLVPKIVDLSLVYIQVGSVSLSFIMLNIFACILFNVHHFKVIFSIIILCLYRFTTCTVSVLKDRISLNQRLTENTATTIITEIRFRHLKTYFISI